VNAALEDPSVWNDPKKAQELGKEKRQLETVVNNLTTLDRDLADNAELFEMSKEEGDIAGLQTIADDAQHLEAIVKDLEFKRMFGGHRSLRLGQHAAAPVFALR
jgi:peptide chain release factor 2